MALEYEIRGGKLLWIKNPVTGVISYVVDLRGKSFAFTLSGREHHPPDAGTLDEGALRHTVATCPFCPGNENQTTPEVFRVTRDEMPHWTGDGAVRGSGWIIRVINNLFPRIPAELTGDRVLERLSRRLRPTAPSEDDVPTLQVGARILVPETGHEGPQVLHPHPVVVPEVDASEHRHERPGGPSRAPTHSSAWSAEPLVSTVQVDPERSKVARSPAPRRSVAVAICSAICAP